MSREPPRPKGSPKTPGSGRQAGVPNKINAGLKEMILGALHAGGGQDWLESQMSKNPAAFMVLVGKVLPLQVSGEGGGPIVIQTISFSDADDPPSS